MTNSNQKLIQQFYEAFSRRDSQTMADCYHIDAVFNDPVFQNLKGVQIGDMWKMLCLQGKSLEIEFHNVEADDRSGKAEWIARYQFGKPPRPVRNQISATFKFKDGKIIEHTDQFDFWKWSRMALGPLGLLMGWHSVVQANIRSQAMKNLTNFTSKIKNT